MLYTSVVFLRLTTVILIMSFVFIIKIFFLAVVNPLMKMGLNSVKNVSIEIKKIRKVDLNGKADWIYH